MAFSPMIQNLISTGGEKAAMNRSAQINGYIANFNAKLNPPKVAEIALPEKTSIQSFQDVLKQSAKTSFGSLLQDPSALKVQAQIYANSTSPATSDIKTPATKSQLLGMVEKVSQKYGVDDKLVKALIKQESGFNPNAKSKVGAMGLMQLMPSTAKGLGVQDAYNPVQNVEGGVKYLKSMLNKYNGNVILALAAYNAGPGAVDKYDGVPPYKETQNYVRSILKNYL